MKLRNLALAVALVAPFAAAQDKKEVPKEATDPVCGMSVETATAPTSDYKGKKYYFCSKGEKEEFDKAPATYIKLDKKDTTKK
jgi:YHS domain-containing protein